MYVYVQCTLYTYFIIWNLGICVFRSFVTIIEIFSRLKVDETGEVLLIPIDIEVVSTGGLYAPDDLIDFGIGGTDDPPKLVKLYLKNSGKKTIKVQVGSWNLPPNHHTTKRDTKTFSGIYSDILSQREALLTKS